MKKKLIITVIFICIVGCIVFGINSFNKKQSQEGDKVIQITVVDVDNNNAILYEGTFETKAELLGDFLNEAKDAIRAGATPEQMATRKYTIAMEKLIADIAEDSGYELGQGFERTENLKALMLYATALSYGDDFASTIQDVPMIKGPTINGEIARDKFKEKIKPLVDMR